MLALHLAAYAARLGNIWIGQQRTYTVRS